MSARGWADRLSGGPSDPGSKPPEGGRGPGSGSPDRSDSPDPSRPDGGVRPRPPVHEPRGSALRVVLVSRDSMLAIALPSLIEAPGVVRTLDWYSDELDSAIRHADVVVIDMPPALYERTFAVIDGRFLGRTVVLLQEGEHPEALPPGPPRAVLYRPLQIAELWAAVTGVWPAVPSAEEAEGSEGTDRGPGEEGPGPEAGADTDLPEPEAGSGQAAAMPGPGLPVAESGLLIGLSGRELEPVIGPGQVAPGMDEDTLERLRRWRTLGRQPPSGTSGTAGAGGAGTRRGRSDRARQASAEARREQARRQQAAKAEARAAAREEAARQREARATAREQARQARQAERQAAQEASRQAGEARAAEKAAARQRARLAKAAEAEARKALEAAARRVKEAEAETRRAAEEAAGRAKAEQAAKEAAAREEARRVKAAQDAERAAAREAARQAQAAERAAAREVAQREKAVRDEARKAARAEASRERAARAEARKAARAEARQVRAERAEAQKVARAEARQERSTQAAARRAARLEARQAKAAEAKVRRAERAEARRVARQESRQARAVRAEARKAARAEASQTRATRRQEAKQARQAKEEVNRAARTQARQERAVATQARRAHAQQARAARAQARKAAREQAAQARAARAEEQRTARDAAARTKAAEAEVKREQTRQAKAAQAAERVAAQEQARQAKAAQAAERAAAREQARQADAARAEERKAAQAAARQARAAQAEARKAARAQAGQERAARAEVRRAARDEARRVRASRVAARKVARAEKAGTRVAGERAWVAGGLQPLLVVVVLAALAVGAAGWRSGGGPDTQAGEVAVVRAAGGAGGGLVAQDPRVGPISPVYALAAGTWLRVNEAKASLEGTVREARVPGRFLLAVVVALTVVLFLLLMRVGPGTGAAAGPGPAPPQRWEGALRIGGAARAGVLVALDPLLVGNGRAATGTILALVLALGALALAWAVPARPALRWLPLVAALGGLALLVSPLALPVLLVPVTAEVLGGRYREAWRSTAALALAIGVWLLLPVWVAGQDLGPGQVGWLLGRPSGSGSLAASMGDAPLSWLLLAAGLAAAILAWRHRSGARPGDGAGDDRPLAWVATTAAGALVAAALGYPAGQALAFAIPAAAVALALAAGRLVVSEAGTRGNTRKLAGGVLGAAAGVVPRWISAGTAVVLAGLVVAQGVDWTSRYSRPADDGLGRLVATVAAQVPRCSAVNASGPDDRARLLAAGVTVTEFSDGPAATAAGVRYFVLTGATTSGGPLTPSLAAWVREHGDRLAAQPSRSLSGIELWRVDPAPLDPVADSLPVPGGMFSNVTGSACGGYRVTDSQLGAFYTAYRAVGGKAVLGRPLGSVWTSDGPALQAFDTMVLGAVPAASGPPAVKPIELPPLLAKLDVEAVADADIPLPSGRPPVTDRQALALLDDELIARAYLGTDPAAATSEDWRRARERFGRPLGTPQTMPDGSVRQPFERAVLELPADGGPARPAALGRLAVRLGLVPKQAMRLEPVPGLPAGPAETRLDTGPLLRPLGLVLGLLALAAAAGTVLTWRSRADRPKEAVADR